MIFNGSKKYSRTMESRALISAVKLQKYYIKHTWCTAKLELMPAPFTSLP